VCIAASHVRSRRVHRIYNTPSKPAHRSSWRLASRKVASGEQRGHEGKAVVVPPRDRRDPPPSPTSPIEGLVAGFAAAGAGAEGGGPRW
jgi:hypothetical protein